MIGNGCNGAEVKAVLAALDRNMVFYDIISDKLGPITGADNVVVVANKSFVTTFPVLCDVLYVVGGTAQDQSMFDLEAQYQTPREQIP